jgi:hypothetical protein
MGEGNLLKYFTRIHQVVEEEEVEHTERWKDQFTVKPGSQGSLIRLIFIGGGGGDVDRS